MPRSQNCGEATIKLLEAYGVDTVFGIPGVHTLELYRGLNDSSIRHVQTRHEQGAGFMADGYARASGRPGVALVISGPGVTNVLTAMGQAYADSIPMLVISADAESTSLGRGWGCLHEVPSLETVTGELTALSATVRNPAEIPALLARAFEIFACERPRPVHIAIPIDVLEMPVDESWRAVASPARREPAGAQDTQAADLLRKAKRPLIYVGGGAKHAAAEILELAERLSAMVACSNAGKGVVPDSHPLSMAGFSIRHEWHELLDAADCVLAIGTELAPVDSFFAPFEINASLIRIDIDPKQQNERFPAEVPINADARATALALLDALCDLPERPAATIEAEISAVKQRAQQALTAREQQHMRVLDAMRQVLPGDTQVFGDPCQLVYTAAFGFRVEQAGKWQYPAGYCTLGGALPCGIGAKLAKPQRPVLSMIGDGGLMFTCQELVTASELGLALPIILWNNEGLRQIEDGMLEMDIPPVGVDGVTPDFSMLARACGCMEVICHSSESLQQAILGALQHKGPTLIQVIEGDSWLTQG